MFCLNLCKNLNKKMDIKAHHRRVIPHLLSLNKHGSAEITGCGFTLWWRVKLFRAFSSECCHTLPVEWLVNST